MAANRESILTDALLARCLERAPVYDRENRWFHPAYSALSHEVVAKLALGLNPDEMPRWG